MKPLYEIAIDYQRMIHELMESDEISTEQIEALNELNGDIKEKIINVSAFIKNLEAEHESIEKAIDAMAERSSKIQKKVEKLKEYLKNNMEICEIKEVKSPYFDIKLRMNPPSVLIKDENLIPKEYLKEIVVHKIDKVLISQCLKNNIPIPGTLLENRTRLEIR